MTTSDTNGLAISGCLGQYEFDQHLRADEDQDRAISPYLSRWNLPMKPISRK